MNLQEETTNLPEETDAVAAAHSNLAEATLSEAEMATRGEWQKASESEWEEMQTSQSGEANAVAGSGEEE